MTSADNSFMHEALKLAGRGIGRTSPNPMVGAVIVKGGNVIGRGWHQRAGLPHAEIEAFQDAGRQGHSAKGATLYVTLEPCCTHGRTPPCTDAIIQSGVCRVVVGAVDPNPRHAGRGLEILQHAGVKVTVGVLAEDCAALNEHFNHWITKRTPFLTIKAAMTLDGKIAAQDGQSKWITGPHARAMGMKLRQRHDAILVGINTILADDPSLTLRGGALTSRKHGPPLRRIILDSMARTPLDSKVIADAQAADTIAVVTSAAPKRRVAALSGHVRVLTCPPTRRPAAGKHPRVNLKWLMKTLGKEGITSILVEGGGEVSASFLEQKLAQRIAFFYAPKILGSRAARPAVAGAGAASWKSMTFLEAVEWSSLGPDLYMTALVSSTPARRRR